MDKKTFAQFLLVSTVILCAWWAASYFILGPAARRAVPLPAPPAPQAQAPAQPQAAVAGTEAPAPPAPVQQQPEAPAVAVETTQIENSHLRLLWTNLGAALQTLTILDPQYRAPYYEGEERPPLVLLRDFQQGLFSDTIEKVTFVTRPDPQGPTNRVDVPTADKVYRIADARPDRLVFEQTVRDDQGHALLIRKTVSLPADAYNYEVTLEFENVSAAPYEVEFALRGAAGIEREALQTANLGTRVAVLTGKDSYKITSRRAQKLEPQDLSPNESTKISWAAVVNHYFVAVLRPDDPEWISSVASELVLEDDLLQARGRWDTLNVRRNTDRRSLAADATVVIRTVPLSLQPGGRAARSYSFIAAPKDRKVLAAYDTGMESLIEFGMFSALSRLALAILNGIHAVLPNYGIAILILTALVRLLLHPLTRKQQVGMIKMQKLQPQIQELQRKYADDKQKLTQEQMALFQKYGVHPLSGCGPMLLQFPVLIALWRALNAAIELRHAGFLWVNDLSRPDTIFHFPFSLPVIWDELNLLPILMTAVMFWQQQGMPSPSSEQAQQQQKMMKWMPLFFVLLFYHQASGLVLYWTASSAIGLAERWIINRHADAIELKPKGERKGKPRGPAAPPKSTWLEKLQKLVEDQTGQGGRGKRKP